MDTVLYLVGENISVHGFWSVLHSFAISTSLNVDVSVNFANTSVDVGEGEGNVTLELIAECTGAIEFDFDVSIDTADASALGEFPSSFHAGVSCWLMYRICFDFCGS